LLYSVFKAVGVVSEDELMTGYRRSPAARPRDGGGGMTAARPRLRFTRPHYAPGLEWSAYQPLLPDWEIVVGDPAAPGALDGVDVLVAAAVDAELIDAGAFGLIQQIGTGTDRIDVEAATQAGVWVSRLPSGLTGNADGVADTAVLLTLAALRRLDESRRALADGRWGEPAGRTLAGRTVVVVGLGDVGERVVARLSGFGPRLIGVRARPERGGPSGLDGVAGPATLAALRRPPPRSALRFLAPVAGPLGDGFGPRGGAFHAGIDYTVGAGTPVGAAGRGCVSTIGWDPAGYGRFVVIAHRAGMTSLYAHLAAVTVRDGACVAASARIGTVGATGNATGPHLHFELRLRGAAVDPLTGL
jgi:murein DD-endopeptidase MepM/ murein hydrolase activator NlpD